MYKAGYICKYIQICIKILYIYNELFFVWTLKQPHLLRPALTFEAGSLTDDVSNIFPHKHFDTHKIHSFNNS